MLQSVWLLCAMPVSAVLCFSVLYFYSLHNASAEAKHETSDILIWSERLMLYFIILFTSLTVDFNRKTGDLSFICFFVLIFFKWTKLRLSMTKGHQFRRVTHQLRFALHKYLKLIEKKNKGSPNRIKKVIQFSFPVNHWQAQWVLAKKKPHSRLLK